MALNLIISGNRGPAGAGFPGGGDAGTVLVKASSVDYDTEWTDTLSLDTMSLDTLAAQSIISNTLVVDSSSMSLGSATIVKSGSDSRVYTLPNRDGTFALLTGPQTFTQTQTFSNDIAVGGNAAVTGNLAVTGNASVGGVATFADGSASDPSIKFSGSGANTGFSRHGLFGIQWAAAGAPIFRINGGDGIEIYGSSVKISSDVFLLREDPNVLAQRNGTSGQSYRLYNTFTDSSNYERAVFAWASNTLRIGTEKAGTGTARGIALVTDGTTRLSIAASGTGTYSGNLTVNGNATATGNLAVTGNASVGGVATFADGSASDPSIKFSGSGSNTGFSRHGLFGIQWVAAGAPVFRINGGDGVEIYGSSVKISSDVFLLREDPNVLAQRNGTSGQSYRLYNTFTDSSNYERAVFAWASNTLRIGTEKAGTGTARGIALVTDGTTRLSIAASGTGTYSGNLAVNGSLTIPNQSLVAPSSALNRSLGDGRYARPGWYRRVLFDFFDQESTANGGSTGTPTSDLYISATTGTSNSGSAMRYTSALRPYLYSYPGNGRLGTTAGIDWSKGLSVHLFITVSTGGADAIDPATEIYWRVGENRASTTFGPNTTRGVGLYMVAGKIVGMVHNGTSLTTGTTALYEKTDAGVWPVLAVEIRHVGSGIYQFFVNGTLMDTLTGGPNTPAQQENIQWAVMARNGASGTQTCTAFIITEPELCYH